MLRWYVALSGTGTEPDVMTAGPAFYAHSSPDNFKWETGITIAHADWFASVTADPLHFTVMSGADEVELADGLIQRSPGILSVGRGEDLETPPIADIDHRADRYGRPVRLARQNDELVVSLSTPMVEAWRADRGPTLGDSEELVAIARGLDSAEVVAAYMAVPMRDYYGVGIGWSTDSDGPVVTVVYDFGDPQSAAAGVSQVSAFYSDGSSVITRSKMSEVVSVSSVSASGRLVIANLRPTESSSVGVVYGLLQSQELELAPRGGSARL